MKAGTGSCCLCQRVCHLTFHHLIPSSIARRKHFRKNYSKEVLQQGLMLCGQCHSGIHKLYDEMTLAKELNTLEKLAIDEAVSRHVQWVARQAIKS